MLGSRPLGTTPLGATGLDAAAGPTYGTGVGSSAGVATVSAETFTTWDPANKHTDLALSNANLTFTRSGASSTYKNVRSTRADAIGRKIVKFTNLNVLDTTRFAIGLANSSFLTTGSGGANDWLGFDANSIGYRADGSVYYNGTNLGSLGAYGGTTVFLAFDFVGDTIRKSNDGTSWSSALSVTFPIGAKFVAASTYVSAEAGTADFAPTGWTLTNFSNWGATPPAAGTSTVSGVGSSAGAATVSASATAIKATVGSSAGTGAASAVGASNRAGAGASSGVATVAGAGVTLRAGVGSSAGTGTASAAGLGLAGGAGTGVAAGSASVAATGSSIAAGAGSSSGAASVFGSSSSAQNIVSGAGSSAGAASITGTGRAIISSVGNAAGTATVTSAGVKLQTISGVGIASGIATVIGSSLARRRATYGFRRPPAGPTRHPKLPTAVRYGN